MLKILYAGGNREGSYFQLKRFLDSFKNKNVEIRTAAYKKSLGNLNIDYNLDSLLNFGSPNDNISFGNNNYIRYCNVIKKYSPDLIISDLEIYTSTIALELNIPLWQASPLLIYYAINNDIKYNLNIHKNHSYLLNKNIKKKDYYQYIINNSDRNYILSHICDIKNSPIIKDNFSWCRPEYVLSDMDSNKYEAMAASIKNNKNIISYLKDKKSIVFSDFYHETYDNIKMKNIFNTEDYINLVGQCKYFICDGSESLAADAFYNRKYCIAFPKYDDIESVVVSNFNEFFNIGKEFEPDLQLEIKDIHIDLKDNVKFLSQYIEKL